MIDNFATTILNSLPVFALIGITLLLRTKKILHSETKNVLRPIIFKLVLPFFVFNALYGLEISKDDLGLIALLAVIATLLVIGFMFVCKINKWPDSVSAAFLICMVGFQVGPFAFPFVQLNFDQNVFSKVIVLDITLFISIMVIGPIIASIYGSKTGKVNVSQIFKTIFTDIVLLTVFFTFTLNFLEIEVSKYILNIVEFIGRPFPFLTLLYVGFTLAKPDMKKISQLLQTFFFRNIILVFVSIILIQFVITDVDLKRALVLTLFTPFSAFALVYTDRYKIDEETIASLSMFSLILYLAIYPFVVTIAKGF